MARVDVGRAGLCENGPELVRRLVLTVPATSGILSVTLTAIDVAGNESARTAPVTKTIAPAGGKE